MNPMDLDLRNHYRPVVEPQELSDGEEAFFAYHPYMPGVDAQGDTAEEATDAWYEALEMYFEHCKKYDLPVPRPNFMRVDVVVTVKQRGTLGDMLNTGPVRLAQLA